MTALVIIEGVVIALLVVLVAGLLRSHAEILRRLHALDGGEAEGRGGRAEGLAITRRPDASRAPAGVGGVTPSGTSTGVALRDTRGLVLLAFLSSGCSTCRPFWESFAGGAEMPSLEVRPVIVTKGPQEESPGRIGELAPDGVLTVMSSEAWDDFKIPVSPYFVLVDAASGTVVGEGAAGSWNHVKDLLSAALADTGHAATTGDTAARSRRTEESLKAAGIQPGDPSLYRNPHGDGP
ncbi:MAG TPA: hypothetical protein VLB85_02205 [Acidimicrobiia bacterium]|nr:hypothetical protein [Acidimicrobiia bacterium]